MMSILNRKIIYWLLLAVVIGQLPVGCARVDISSPADGTDQRLLLGALSHIDNEYVEPVDSRPLVYAAIRSMMATLDPHSSFLTPAEFKALLETTHGEFGGVGIEVTWHNGELVVVAPLADTPAGRAGIVSGDRILEIDGEPVPADINQVVARLRGVSGSVVTLLLQRSGQSQPIRISLVREQIHAESVSARFVAPGVGYLRVRHFQEHTDSELHAALASLKRQGGGEFTGLILDLRDNPGGLLDQAVKVADLFLERGVIVSTKGRDSASDFKFMAHQNGTEPFCPLLVLVNERTASAAEIVAGALHDQQRAVLIGVRSYGKGSVQKLIELADGSGLRLTTAHYYTPAGVSIQGHGIDPDLPVSQQIEASAISDHAAADRGRQVPVSKKVTGAVPVGADKQLQKALDVLNNWPPTDMKTIGAE